MKYALLILGLFSATLVGFTQTLPTSRTVDWTLAGLRDTTTEGLIEVDMQASGAIGDGVTPNDLILLDILAITNRSGAILNFPNGDFLFNLSINLPSNVIIRGVGAENTTFMMDLGGTNNAFNIQGSSSNADTTSLSHDGVKGNTHIVVLDATDYNVGDWIQLIQSDGDLITSSWALKSIGQIAKIILKADDKIVLDSPLRLDYSLSRSPYIQKIDPVKNVGIECLKILRIDDTSPIQTSNINFKYAVNSWVKGIESENCNFSHIELNNSSNIQISKSYFHHAFDYGSDERGYGILLQFTSNECLIEDNIFEHLRHAMILQAGSNANVFAYNFSRDPFWTSNPSDAAGDIVLHGNYPYSNLFEQNICRNIIIDYSHGPNGSYNTFFRNRAEGFGIIFTASNSPNQNVVGNDISNITFPYYLVNYTISGTGHFIHGNNNKGIIHPTGTAVLPDLSYAYLSKPDFIPANQWAALGTPNVLGAASIPSRDRYDSGSLFSNSCPSSQVGITENSTQEKILIYPNPINSELIIESDFSITNLKIINVHGQIVYSNNPGNSTIEIETESWNKGVYLVLINGSNNLSVTKKVIKN